MQERLSGEPFCAFCFFVFLVYISMKSCKYFAYVAIEVAKAIIELLMELLFGLRIAEAVAALL